MALYAEQGHPVEARAALLQALDARTYDEPESADWYVLGRIAENYGVKDAALAAYKNVEQDDDIATTWELTERRLAALGKK